MDFLIYHLIAVAVVGFTAALIIFLLKKTFGINLPGYLYPIAVGAAMLSYSVWAEYTWYARTAASLPAHAKVAQSYELSSAAQPWTLLAPSINRFAVVELSTLKKNPKLPGHALVSVLLVARFENVIELPRMFDCIGQRVADIDARTAFGEDGLPVNASWSSGPENTPQLDIVCAELEAKS